MQSGSAQTKDWVLEHEPASPRVIDPLMGWTGSGDTNAQIRLRFETREAAIAYAERNGLAYTVEEPKPHRTTKRSYSDNFKWGRKDAWTH